MFRDWPDKWVHQFVIYQFFCTRIRLCLENSMDGLRFKSHYINSAYFNFHTNPLLQTFQSKKFTIAEVFELFSWLSKANKNMNWWHLFNFNVPNYYLEGISMVKNLKDKPICNCLIYFRTDVWRVRGNYVWWWNWLRKIVC